MTHLSRIPLALTLAAVLALAYLSDQPDSWRWEREGCSTDSDCLMYEMYVCERDNLTATECADRFAGSYT